MTSIKEQKMTAYNNQPVDILSAWFALEVLSPQTFKKPKDIILGNFQVIPLLPYKGLPWEMGIKRDSAEDDLFYQILLGSLDMQPINELLLKKFGNEFGERFQSKQKAALAFITVNAQGRIGEEKNIAISSFAWGYPQVLKGNLLELSEWSVAESKLKSALFDMFSDGDEKGEKNVVTRDRLTHCLNYLVEKLELVKEHFDPSIHFIQTYYEQSKNKKNKDTSDDTVKEETQKYPDTPLLNSFYLGELTKAKTLFGDKHSKLGTELFSKVGDGAYKEAGISSRR